MGRRQGKRGTRREESDTKQGGTQEKVQTKGVRGGEQQCGSEIEEEEEQLPRARMSVKLRMESVEMVTCCTVVASGRWN